MNKAQFKLQLDHDVLKRLCKISDRYGMTPNAIVAAAAYELSRVRPENFWHAMGRIAEGEGAELPAPAPVALPAARKAPSRARSAREVEI